MAHFAPLLDPPLYTRDVSNIINHTSGNIYAKEL
jgi:hypothetical protein